MSEYILILVWLAAMTIVFAVAVPKQKIRVCGEYEYRYPFFLSLVVMIPVIIWAGTRTNFGDTETYRRTFLGMPSSIGKIGSYIAKNTKDKGFSVFSIILKSIIGNHDVVYFLLIAAIQGVILVYVYRKYSSAYLISIFLFLASTDYLSWMFNGMRQFLAATISFFAIKYILRKQYVQAVCIILLAATIHQSALLVIPFIFIAQGKAWNKKTLFFIFSVMVIVLFINQFTNIFADAIANTQYNDIMTNGIWEEDDGTSFLRVLIYSVPAILSFIGRKQIRSSDNRVINLCTNMSIVAAGLYVVAMFTSGIYIGRLPIYFSLYSYILLPWEIDNIFTKESAQLMNMMMIGAYLVFYYFQCHMTWALF